MRVTEECLLFSILHSRMRYLVATDSSGTSNEAVTYAAEHAAAFDADLEIVHVVVPEMELLGDELVLQGHKAATDEGERVLDHAVELAREAVPDRDLEIDTLLLTGQPAGAIVERATEADADAIFVGHRGLSSEQERVVGSVAKGIVSKAEMPVTVVR